MSIEANSLLIEAKGTAYQFDVAVQIVGKTKTITFNKETASPLDKLYNRSVLALVNRLSDAFGVKNLKYVYDGSSILYTNVDFKGIDYELEPQSFTEELKKAFRHNLMVSIKPTESHHVLDMNKSIEQMSIDERGEFKRLISLLVSQDVVNRGEFCVLNQNNLFSTDPKKKIDVPGGIEFRPGFSKSVRFVKNDKNLQPVIDIDVRTSAFYKSQTVIVSGQECQDLKAASDLLKNVIVHPEYNIHRRLKFSSFSNKSAKEQTFECDNAEMTVYDYFTTKKNLKINPSIPLSIVKPKEAGFFPSDKLVIAQFQKVPIERLDSNTVDQLHRTNAVQANIRYRATVDVMRALNLNNDIIRSFGFKFTSNMVVVKPQPMSKPRVQLGSNVATPKDDGSFRDPRARYSGPTSIPAWAVFYGTGRGQRIDVGIINQLVKNLMDKGKQKGMNIPQPKDISGVDVDRFTTVGYDKCSSLSKAGVKFIMVIDNKTQLDTHKLVKLMECRYRVITQQLNYQLVDRCVKQNQNMTLENILNKMNVKNGGLNYAPKFEEEAAALSLDKTFVLGYQARHSKFSNVGSDGKIIREPSAIGFSGNYGRHHDMFIGSYVFQQDPRYDVDYETVDPRTLEAHVTHVLKQRAKSQQNAPKPPNFVIMRDGVSEYQYGKLLTEELDAIRRGIAAYDQAWKPKILLCVTTKDHNVRLYLNNNGRIDNPPPGTVITDGIVRKGIEFFITPQKAIKGTAEPLRVTILLNETSASFTGIQKFVHSLCYSHQLTCAPTALPEPIYQSNILSQRAHSLLGPFRELFPNAIPYKEQTRELDIAGLNGRLSTNNTPLENFRYTA